MFSRDPVLIYRCGDCVKWRELGAELVVDLCHNADLRRLLLERLSSFLWEKRTPELLPCPNVSLNSAFLIRHHSSKYGSHQNDGGCSWCGNEKQFFNSDIFFLPSLKMLWLGELLSLPISFKWIYKLNEMMYHGTVISVFNWGKEGAAHHMGHALIHSSQ